jgi:uncharacterized coiled-coil DUF342 family protein
MSNEVRELKDHVQWLEHELGTSDRIEEQLNEIKDDISSAHERLDKICDAFNNVANVINAQSKAINALIEAHNSKQSRAAQSPFGQGFNSPPPRPPKQPKFRPKVVDKDQPDGLDAA